MNKNDRIPIIGSVDYNIKQLKNEHYEGYVVYPNGEVIAAFTENVMCSSASNYYIDEHSRIGITNNSEFIFSPGVRYHENPTPYICESSSTYVDKINFNDENSFIIKRKPDSETENIKKHVKEQLLDAMISYYEAEEYSSRINKGIIHENTPFSLIRIEIDVPNPITPYQRAFAKYKKRIESEELRKNELPYNVVDGVRKELELYSACFDPNDKNYKHFWDIKYHIGAPTGVESYIPVWANLKNSLDSFQRGYYGDGGEFYFYGVGYFSLSIADLIMIGSGVAALQARNASEMLLHAPLQHRSLSFPKVRNGYGVFGKNGLNIGNYKINALYENGKINSGGTIISIKQSTKGGALFRLDYGFHPNEIELWHYHYRYFINGQKRGSSKPRYFYE